MKSNEVNDILKLLSIIANNDGISIRKLNEITAIPVEVIKRNLEFISFNSDFYFLDLQPDEDYEENDDTYMDVTWTIENFSEDMKVLNLNNFEKYLFKNIINIVQAGEDDLFDIKTKSIYRIPSYKYELYQIALAIERKNILKVFYGPSEELAQSFLIEPLSIVFYEFENIFYILGQYNGQVVTYRLDRMIKITETKEDFVPIKSFSVKTYLANIWGMEQGEAVKVKVKFLKEANVEYNVKRDLESKENKIIYEFNDYFIYEDIVIGINSFKNWLRSFGSSAIVIEPEWLKEEMIESAKRCLEYYIK